MLFRTNAVRRTIKEQSEGCSIAGKPKRLAYSTIEYETPDGERRIRHHLTDIITFRRNGDIVLNTDGHFSVTTKQRLNEYVPGLAVWSNKGWRFRWKDKATGLFQDGLVLHPNGTVSGDAKEKDNSKALREIAKFVKMAAKVERLPEPSLGDCWYCCLVDKKGRTMGELGGNASNSAHIVEHVKEGYLHGSLIIQALKHAGYKDWQLPHVWKIRDIVTRSLRKYVKAAYGIAS